jgi:hypothetical protein
MKGDAVIDGDFIPGVNLPFAALGVRFGVRDGFGLALSVVLDGVPARTLEPAGDWRKGDKGTSLASLSSNSRIILRASA